MGMSTREIIDKQTKKTLIPFIEKSRLLKPWEMIQRVGGAWHFSYSTLGDNAIIDKKLIATDG